MASLVSINNYYYYRGGAETVFLEHNRMFEARGWQVVPFAMHHPRNLGTSWSEYFVDEIEFGENYSLAQKLVRVPKVIYSFEARKKLERLVDRVKPDVAHAHNIYHHLSPSILSVLKDRSIPTVMTLHDLKLACPAYNMLSHDGVCERCKGGRLHNVVANRCIKNSVPLSAIVMMESLLHSWLGTYRHCVDRFVVPSRFYIEKLTEWGIPKERFTHIPNFVDASRHEAQFAPGRRFVYFGRLSREKGLVTLIRATVRVGGSLTVIGTGPQLEELKALATELQADVEFSGYLTGDALKAAIRMARAVILPSEWYENAPMTVIEAYASGKPVIGARIGGIPELIRENETGATFISGNVEDLAGVLDQFSSAPDESIETMGRAGRAWAELDFSLQSYHARMLATYRELGAESPEELLLGPADTLRS